MFASVCGKTPRDQGAAFVAENATVVGDVTLAPGSTVWYGAVIRGDEGFTATPAARWCSTPT